MAEIPWRIDDDVRRSSIEEPFEQHGGENQTFASESAHFHRKRRPQVSDLKDERYTAQSRDRPCGHRLK